MKAITARMPSAVFVVGTLSLVLATLEAQELAPDTLRMADGSSVKGVLLDLTDAEAVVMVAGERKALARSQVKDIQRAAAAKTLGFLEKKAAAYRKSDKDVAARARLWLRLADFCAKQESKLKQSFSPERRQALREVVRLDPNSKPAREGLGQAQLNGAWLSETEVAEKLKAGYSIVGGSLVRDTKTTVRTGGALPKAYKIVRGEELNERKIKKIEKDRTKRLKSAEKFLAEKQREYEGVPWSKRYKIPTPNFVIHCNSTLKVARAYGALMELIRAELAKMFPSKIQRQGKAHIYIYASQEDFMSQDDYGRYGGRGLGGYYVPTTQKVACFHGTFGFTGTTFGVLCHEGTHYYQGLVLKNFRNIPIWLVEGLAVYFGDGSKFDPKKGKITVGQIPRDRLSHLQEKMEKGRHTDVEKLISMKRGFGGFNGSHYADSWGLIYFLVNSGKDGTRLMTEYWARGLVEELKKKHFTELVERYFGSYEDLQDKYESYIKGLKPPPAGVIQGPYFSSDYFQFDVRLPSAEWSYFEDASDKKLLVGMLQEKSPAEPEVRIYYANNMMAQRGSAYIKDYVKGLESKFGKVKQDETKISNLDAYVLNYTDPNEEKESKDGADKKKPKGRVGPRDVTEYLLIQIDGIVVIRCTTKKGERGQVADDFDKVRASFTQTLTRRW